MLRQLALALAVVLVGSSVLASSGLAHEAKLPEVAAPSAAVHMTFVPTHEPLRGLSIGQAIYQGATDPRFEERVQHYLADHGLDHPQRMDLGGLTPLEAATTTLTQELRGGRTVVDWVKLARADNLASLAPSGPERSVDLVDAVARLNAAAGFPLTPAQRADVRAQADALPADVREPFAQLVAATADAYVAQAPTAAAIISRLGAEDGTAFFMTPAERETTLATGLELLAAQNAFRARIHGVAFPASSTALFADPNGLVFLGSTGADTYTREGVLLDPALVVEPSGDDLYLTTAGSACPDITELIHDCNGLVASVVLDLAGNDRYAFSGAPTDSQGAASLGGIGILFDVMGDDVYYTHYTQTLTPGPLWGGPTGYYVDGGAQGYGLAAFGLLLDPLGDDVWESDVSTTRLGIWDLAQGFGNGGGVGIAADGTGNDEWLAYSFEVARIGFPHFSGAYPGGVGFFGGIGVMTDTGAGADKYHAWDNGTTTDYYAFGFGAFGGTGIFFEDGGNDDYQAVEIASDPWISPLLNCAFGTASFAGLGVFLEMGGDDHYFGDTRSPRNVATMNEGFGGPAEGEGIFIDVSGDDGHFMEAHKGGVSMPSMTHGRGILLGGGEGLSAEGLGGNTFGLYLDLMGADQYTGAAPSQNNAAWPFGADVEAGSLPQIFTGAS